MPFADGIGPGTGLEGSFLAELARFIGTTVTIYMTSGGQSGFGVTGVLTNVNPSFIKLITCIGPAPCCCLGSACTGGRIGPRGGFGAGGGFASAPFLNNVGSVVDIPVDKIAAYVHNAV